jgi:excisionase family DNA binding protein
MPSLGFWLAVDSVVLVLSVAAFGLTLTRRPRRARREEAGAFFPLFGRTDAMSARVGQQGQRQMADAPLLSEPLMTADEAAKLLHVPRSTLYELVRSRGLPHVRIGLRGLRFTRTDLARWVSENSVVGR